ncbi:MAG: cupredoxin domain-containing protein [Solirubrobacterales bacterium]
MRLRRLILFLAMAGLAVLGATHALASSEPITASTVCCSYGKTQFTIDRGTVATFQNQDPGISPHDVAAVDVGPNGQPLFRSATINQGQTPVNGTDTLAAGSYRFFCTVHPTAMAGELVVTGTAPPTTKKKRCKKKAKKGSAQAAKKCKKKRH